MSYQKDRDEFVGVIVDELCNRSEPESIHEYTNPPSYTEAVDLARLILRNASTVQRLAVEDCNRPLSDGERKQWAAAVARIAAACKPWGIMPLFDEDPRGASVKLILPSGRSNSWGGEKDGFCVPTR